MNRRGRDSRGPPTPPCRGYYDVPPRRGRPIDGRHIRSDGRTILGRVFSTSADPGNLSDQLWDVLSWVEGRVGRTLGDGEVEGWAVLGGLALGVETLVEGLQIVTYCISLQDIAL